MRSTTLLILFAFFVGGCGDDGGTDDLPADQEPAARAGSLEDPGLPTDSTDFRATPWADAPGAADIQGSLWVSSAATVEQDGFSLIAQLRGLPEGTYSWALHRGACAAPDDRLLGLGYGTIADEDGRGAEIANGGGPLGEMRMTFIAEVDGTARGTVFVPLGGEVTRAEMESGPHSLRLHRQPGRDETGPSVACAPLPALPGPEEGS